MKYVTQLFGREQDKVSQWKFEKQIEIHIPYYKETATRQGLSGNPQEKEGDPIAKGVEKMKKILKLLVN